MVELSTIKKTNTRIQLYSSERGTRGRDHRRLWSQHRARCASPRQNCFYSTRAQVFSDFYRGSRIPISPTDAVRCKYAAVSLIRSSQRSVELTLAPASPIQGSPWAISVRLDLARKYTPFRLERLVVSTSRRILHHFSSHYEKCDDHCLLWCLHDGW